MIKDVHINNPKRPLLRGSNSDTDSAHSRRAPRLRGVLEAVAAGKVRGVAFSPKLAIASFIIHHLGWQASNMVWGHLSEMLYRASEATTFVNTYLSHVPIWITSDLPTTQCSLLALLI